MEPYVYCNISVNTQELLMMMRMRMMMMMMMNEFALTWRESEDCKDA